MENRLWQFALAGVFGALIYAKPLGDWIQAQRKQKTAFPLGYLFAAFCALLGVLVLDAVSGFRPLPRFDDLFLIGIAVTAYFFGAKPAVFLWSIDLAVSAWVLPPDDSFGIADPAELFRFASFALVSALTIWAVTGLKDVRRRPPSQGYFFASAYAVIGTLLLTVAFHARPVPRFNDVFMVGIAMTAYFFAAGPAAYLLAVSVAITMWVLPPGGSFLIADPSDYYRLLSFTAVSGLVIFIIHRLKASSPPCHHAVAGD